MAKSSNSADVQELVEGVGQDSKTPDVTEKYDGKFGGPAGHNERVLKGRAKVSGTPNDGPNQKTPFTLGG